MMRTLIFATIVFAIMLPTSAQNEDYVAPIISADNISQLQSVMTIDLADFVDNLGTFDTGWFVINDDASKIAMVNNQDEIIIWDNTGQIIHTYASQLESDVVDLAFSSISETFVSLHRFVDGVQLIHLDLNDLTTDEAEFTLSGLPVELWIDENDIAWTEVIDDESSVVQLSEDLLMLTNVPENDPNGFVRIGRIQPPYAVTSSFEGLVSLWDMENAELIAEAQVATGPAVFGQINASASHLAWRDPYSEGLYLLDFATGENQIVTELGNVYVQFYFLTNDADVIIGVNMDDVPNIVAWIVSTGDRIELGEYRACGRVPDMVRLSPDGTSLIIGCDAGLDIWQIID